MAFNSNSKGENTIIIKNLPEDLTTSVFVIFYGANAYQLENALDEYGPVRRAIIVNVRFI